MAFSQLVEQWRSLAEQFESDAPTDYMLDWIAKESGGNRCNLTTSAGFNEVGLFQLDNGNMAQAGTSIDVLRHGCSGQTDVDPSPENLRTAMSSGVDYINALKAATHARLRELGVDWSESDPGFWALVRLQHAAGAGATSAWLRTAAANLGRGPDNWDEFASASGAASNHWVQVSAENGSWAAGYRPPLISKGNGLLLLAGVLGLVVGALVREGGYLKRFGL